MNRVFETNLYCPHCGEPIFVSAHNTTDDFMCIACGRKISADKMLRDNIDTDDVFYVNIPMATESLVENCDKAIMDVVVNYQAEHDLIEGYCGHNMAYPDGWQPYQIGFTGGPNAETYEGPDGEMCQNEHLYIPPMKDIVKILQKIDEILDKAEAECLPALWGPWSRNKVQYFVTKKIEGYSGVLHSHVFRTEQEAAEFIRKEVSAESGFLAEAGGTISTSFDSYGLSARLELRVNEKSVYAVEWKTAQ